VARAAACPNRIYNLAGIQFGTAAVAACPARAEPVARDPAVLRDRTDNRETQAAVYRRRLL